MTRGKKGPGIPRARADRLLVHKLDEETLVYDLDCHKAHCLNETAVHIWKQCDGQTTLAEMVERLDRQLPDPVDEDVVWLALNQLSKARLLQGRLTQPTSPGVSRREVMRKLALGTAASLPFITTIVAPRPLQAASCKLGGEGPPAAHPVNAVPTCAWGSQTVPAPNCV